jgi:hypothetical protein
VATVRAAGIDQLSAGVREIELPEPRALAPDEVLIEVRAAGVGNWDEYVRTGGWDVGEERLALAAVADGGRLATITGSPPQRGRAVKISNVYVRVDSAQLRSLAARRHGHELRVSVARVYELARASDAWTSRSAGLGARSSSFHR